MRRRNLRIRTNFLRIILAVILLLAVLFSIYTLSIHNRIRSSEKDDNLNSAKKIQSALDDTWDTLLNHCLPLINGTTAVRLDGAADYEALQSASVYMLYTDIRNAVVFDTMLEDITVYYPESDYVVGALGVKHSRTYWALTYGLDGQVNYDQWVSQLYCYGQSGYFLINGNNSSELYFRYCTGSEDNRILLVRIDQQTVTQRLRWVLGNAPDAFAALLDTSGDIYACTDNAQPFLDPQTGKMLPLDESFLCTVLPSSIDGIEYLTIAKKSDVYRLSSSSVTLALVLLGGAVLLATVLSYWMIRQHVTPWEEMAAKLSKGGRCHYNELDVINTAINELLKEQDSLIVLSKQQQLIISRAFMTELLQGNPLNKKNPESIAAVYGISFEYNNFCLIARKCGSDDSEEAVMSLLLKLSDTVSVYWLRQQEADVFLLNYDISASDISAEFLSQLTAISGPDAVIAVSPRIDSPLQIMDCWIFCARELGCTHLLPKSHLQKASYPGVPSSPLLEQFRQYLATGDFAQAQGITASLFADYINDTDIFLFNYKNYRLIHILLPYCPARLHQSLMLLSQTRTQAEWCQLLGGILTECIGTVRQQIPFADGDVAGKVRSIIDSQYNNPMLDLNMISTQVNLSQSYISRMFKQKYGSSVAQYINFVRIEKAKALILRGNDSIKAIAIKVGFAGDAQFIRAFKRQEDVTPGNFRSNNTL